MYYGWLEYGGIELINAARAKAYIDNHLPVLDVQANVTGLREARGDVAYTSPAADNAPWYKPGRDATGRFYGLFPATLTGADDSSRSVTTIELAGDGATHAKPRYGSREIRVTAIAFAEDSEAMSEGLAWVRDVLATGECAANTGSCTDNDLRLYSNLPTDGLLDNHMLRSFLRVEVLSNLSVTKEWGSRVSFVGQTSYVAKAVEFIFSAGMPWAFTEKQLVGSLDMGTGTWSFADPDGEDCYSINNAYASFVNDPFYTSITLPPAPPTVKPPNIIKPSSWRRRSLTITQSEVDRWGRVAPVVTVSAGDAGLSTLRVRFYGNGVSSGCGFEGEYLISYVPPNSTMVLDAMRRDVTITRADGSKVPGGHLVYGSDGLPMKWPSLGCAATYVMVADLLPGQSGITVLLESSVRE